MMMMMKIILLLLLLMMNNVAVGTGAAYDAGNIAAIAAADDNGVDNDVANTATVVAQGVHKFVCSRRQG